MSTDLREGTLIPLPDLPESLEAYLQPSGDIAVWDPVRWKHVMFPVGYTPENFKAGLYNLGYTIP